jgi:S-adenosylmethionine:tRNA ribosyltransferase-isomerase
MQIDSGPQAEILASLDGARRMVRFSEPIEPYLPSAGHVPLPPYIHEALTDPERYQTVYARQPGSAAAPTAGLHFTPELLEKLHQAGIGRAYLTLHVGLDTFAPVAEEDPETHPIHSEWCQIPAETALAINRTRRSEGRIVAVGTTSVRTLETAARFAAPGEVVDPFEGPTSVYILPGYRFQAVDALITNFHLPRSTLLMLVSAFAGRETILRAYQTAIRTGYRFYSFGDAMLIL